MYSVRRQKRECVFISDRVWLVKSPSPVKSSSYELSGIECMERTTSEDVLVILPMAVIV
jgi:hypothetical protein